MMRLQDVAENLLEELFGEFHLANLLRWFCEFQGAAAQRRLPLRQKSFLPAAPLELPFLVTRRAETASSEM
jgi:hypothetical protein